MPPGQALEDADGLVAWAESVEAVTADATPAGTVPEGKALAAIHHIISAAGGNPDFTTPASATEIRLYHPGLASDQDLRVAAAAVDRFLSARGHGSVTKPFLPNGGLVTFGAVREHGDRQRRQRDRADDLGSGDQVGAARGDRNSGRLGYRND